MTLRDYLNQHMRRSTISCWLGIPFAVIAVAAAAHPMIQRVALVITAICFASNIYHNFVASCPRCRTRLLLCVAINGFLLKIPSWFNSCPSCGLWFDTQLDAPQRSNHAMELTASRRTTMFSITSDLPPAAERAPAPSSSSCSR
jgi:hypothetical protein